MAKHRVVRCCGAKLIADPGRAKHEQHAERDGHCEDEHDDRPKGVENGAGDHGSARATGSRAEEAASRGLFGAPSFTIGDGLFWGNDRLEAALAWAKEP